MNPELSPQILAVLKVLENRMGAPPVASPDAPTTFDDRFRTFEGERALVMPHEIQYGMSRQPFDRKVIDDVFANASMTRPGEPDFDPNLTDFLSPGN
jgi:hypothetical protein